MSLQETNLRISHITSKKRIPSPLAGEVGRGIVQVRASSQVTTGLFVVSAQPETQPWTRPGAGVTPALPCGGRCVCGGAWGTRCLPHTGLVTGSFMSFENGPVRPDAPQPLSMDTYPPRAASYRWMMLCLYLNSLCSSISFIHSAQPRGVSPRPECRRESLEWKEGGVPRDTECSL